MFNSDIFEEESARPREDTPDLSVCRGFTGKVTFAVPHMVRGGQRRIQGDPYLPICAVFRSVCGIIPDAVLVP